jgi:hypothetical protein
VENILKDARERGDCDDSQAVVSDRWDLGWHMGAYGT